MDRKYWLRTLVALGIVLPGAAEAMGLGSLVILSAPGEPFHAEIPIHAGHPGELSGARAGLASSTAYSMIHLPVAQGLEHWHFEIRSGPAPAIVISSPVPISSASLQFLVQLDWSGGQMVREYVASEGSGMYGVPASSSLPMRTVPLYHRQPSAAAAPGRMVNGWASVSRYGPVPEHSSLYQIARDINRSQRVAPDQAMAALARANPEAFRNGNPAFLFAGSMLMVPSLAQVEAFTPAEAHTWLRRQTNKTVRPAAAQPGVSSTAPGKKTVLVLSSAPKSLQKPGSAAGVPAAALGQGGEQQLLAENVRLKGMVQSMEQRLNQTGQVLSAQSAELSRLSEQGEHSGLNPLLWLSLGGNLLLLLLFVWMYRRQEETLSRQRDISNKVTVLASAPRATAPSSSLRTDTTAPESAPWTAPTASAATVATAAVPVTQPRSGGGAENRPAEVISSAVAEEEYFPSTGAGSGLAPLSYGAGMQGTEEPAEENRFEVDPIEQADLYLTYGKSEQAVTVLQEGLEANPRRKDLYVRLLSLYETLDRRDEYLDLAERMRGRFGPNNAAWQEVEVQGARLFPGNPLFVTPAEPGERPSALTGGLPGPGQDRQEDMIPGPSVEPVGFPAPANEGLDFLPAETPQELSHVDGGPEKLDFHLDHFFSAGGTLDTHEETGSGPAPSDEHKRGLFATLNEEFRALEEKAEPAPGDEARPDFLLPPEMPEGHMAFSGEPAESLSGGEPDAAGDWDAVGTKLDLGKAYLEMGDKESARELLEEVSREGNPSQRDEAFHLLSAL